MKHLIPLSIDVGYLPVPEYARRTGQSVASVQKQVAAGKLPIRPKEINGGKTYINNALLIKQALEADY